MRNDGNLTNCFCVSPYYFLGYFCKYYFLFWCDPVVIVYIVGSLAFVALRECKFNQPPSLGTTGSGSGSGTKPPT